MTEKKRTYIYGRGKEGRAKRYVHEWAATDKENCDMCRAMVGFLHDDDIPENDHKKIDPLCEENLRRHLASGKHWKHTNGFER